MAMQLIFSYVDATTLTITAGGASQLAFAANPYRGALFIQNPYSATENLFVNFTTAAGVGNGSIELGPGLAINLLGSTGITNQQVNVYAATTGHAFVAKTA